MRALLIAAFASFIAVPGADAAQTTDAKPSAAEPGLLDKLPGDWVMRGDLDGKKTVHDVHVRRVLNGRYVRLDETSRERNEHGEPAYAAQIFIGWVAANGTYACIWLDSTAVAQGVGRCSAKPERHRIPFLFEDMKGTINFSNTFTYDPATDQWEWQLDDIANGKHTPFGHVILSRR